MTLFDLLHKNELDIIIDRVNTIRVTDITRDDVLTALLLNEESLQSYVWPGEVWYLETTSEYVEDFVMSCNFDFVQTGIVHDSSIQHLSQFETRVAVKLRGKKWIVHKCDKDPFPSDPHAHNIEQNLKLNLENGVLYRRRERIDKLTLKELKEIRQLFENRKVKLPLLSEDSDR